MKKILLIVLGSISLGLGVIGIFLPVIPTTPFLLLSLWLYMRSSKKLYNFVLTNKYLGPYVNDYISGKGIPIKAKKKAIFLIWLTIGFSTIFIIGKAILKVMLLSIATIVSAYIWTRKTRKVK
ncbi:YbaN family protein [Clostridium sp. D2Q-11]|uniref:YbaN family protein n=1 Tax=Anaeromonas frigoriresistens TaxID=2683708 RepID=A0A942Z9J6_9FIRM|nr:YbaN family protein [Anaeromonas frigoriresistens]MBS4539393.1 YbaN family protein [Anaeromonas frigoriresistens]